ncbi:CGH_3_HP_G0017780.mRNA.1.CDS.1 [Saccharomyces cerevisiae]|nr:CGH_3_HP_G0017780.mRNA.1.CDS.1 [Saccharomyces cerevisiae]CAI5015434.1 CGH_1_HP_G0087780.mRNA.1.CDS.1 [Saccharomyces cerevisiae]CAI5021395.1 CGH_1_HP_G0093240.mRNA.1.CDS.1 [Saccharomyces cerevisiae]CAI6394207.1 CGH_3_HP_G0017780.mRNA.1.CDS.1 [Saccharomyces cerevisiae]CAI6933363.1 CGH_1_HP_G0087780.mRNA.1.CDS.1 [Saccharomyces cerevisiae]
MQPYLKKNTHVTDDPKAIPLKEGSPDNPESPLISADIVLPEDEFASYQSYLLYEIVRAKYIMINFLLFVVTILATLTDIWFSGVLSPAMVIRICLGGSMVVLQIWSFSRPISNETFRTKLLLEVIFHRPSIAGKEWKTITYNMNQYLFKAGLWKTPYHFFCEHQCYEFFKDLIKGKYPDVQWDTANTQPFISAPENQAATQNSDVEPTVKWCLFKAAEIQAHAVREYWQSQYPDVGIPAI